MIVIPHRVKTHTLWVSEIGSSQSPYAVYISVRTCKLDIKNEKCCL